MKIRTTIYKKNTRILSINNNNVKIEIGKIYKKIWKKYNCYFSK